MMRMILAIVMLASGLIQAEASSAPAPELLRVPLIAWLAARPHVSADSLPDMAFDPISRGRFADVLRRVIAGDYAGALPIARRIGYEVVFLDDGNQRYTVVQEDWPRGIGPTVVISHQPRRNVIAEAPHATFEQGTSEQAAILLSELGFRAAILSGAHRCAARSFVQCRGHTAVCGDRPGSPYRTSDVAHNPALLYQVAHETLTRAWPGSKAISLHGMRRRGDTIAVLSDGSDAMDGPQQATVKAIRDGFRARLGSGGGGIRSCNHSDDAQADFPRLCGTTSVQAIDLNGGSAQCGMSVGQSTGRFVHLEQSWDILGDFHRQWAVLHRTRHAAPLIAAIAAAFPEDLGDGPQRASGREARRDR